MPAPKVATVDAFFAKLGDAERPHMEALRALSLAEAKKAGLVEGLKWNWPAYMSPRGGMVWTLQCFKKHGSLRFPVRFFADHRAEVDAAGYEAIEGALKLTWAQTLPKSLVTKLLRARVRDFEEGNTAWSEATTSTAKVAKVPTARADRTGAKAGTTTWVALLRAVNVGGFTLEMADVRAVCERAGFTEVRTYIASGNVVLRKAGDERKVKREIEAALIQLAGKPVSVVVRSGAELCAVLAENPFVDTEPNRVIVLFLDEPPPRDVAKTAKNKKGERIALGSREIYIDYSAVGGQGKSKLQLAAAKTGTGRNVNTVAKLVGMAKG